MANVKKLEQIPLSKDLLARNSDKPATAIAAKPVVEDADPIETWVEQHPEGKDFSDASPIVEASTEGVTDEPVADPQPQVEETTTDADAAPVVADDKPAAAIEAKTDATPVATEPKPAEAAVAEPKPSYSADEKIYLREGEEPWTRDQVVRALMERAANAPLAEEAQTFRTIFGQDAKTAQAQWTPILEKIRANPALGDFLDSALASNPEKLDYLVRSAKFYDEQSPSQSGTTAETPAGTPATDPAVSEVLAYIRHAKKEAANNRLQREWTAAVSKYPFLQSDVQAQQALSLLAKQLHAEDIAKGMDEMEARGLADALALNAATYDARMIAINAQNAPAQPAPSTVSVPVPAVLGSQGASPGGTRPVNDHKPRKFETLEDATQDWLDTQSGKFD